MILTQVKKYNAIIGSGGLVVMDENTCMVDVAKFFMGFTQRESCGKCGPCRIGTKRMLEILEKITEGKGEMEDLDKLEETCEVCSVPVLSVDLERVLLFRFSVHCRISETNM